MPKALNEDAQKIVASLIRYFERERDNDCSLLPLNAVRENLESSGATIGWQYSGAFNCSLSNLFKRTLPVSEKTVTNKLNKAQRKLLEVISDVMKNSKDVHGSSKTDFVSKAYYLTLDQYKDAVWAAGILKEVDVLMKNNKKYLNKNFKMKFDFESAKVKVNKYGKIYVDTAILVQLMELHNVLGKLMEHIQESPLDGHSDTLTEVSLDDSAINADRKLNDLLAELDSGSDYTNSKGHLMSSKEILTALSVPLHNKFTVMQTGTSELPPLTEEQISESRDDIQKQETMRIKSSSSLKHNEVTDAAGARRIIIRCLSDLDKVKHYLYTVDQGFDFNGGKAQAGNEADEQASDDEGAPDPSPDEVDPGEVPSSGLARQTSKELTRGEGREPAFTRDIGNKKGRGSAHDLNKSNSQKKSCCCIEDCPADEPLEFTWKEGDKTSSKLVICIKGKTEEDGDVHVVIRQCPECQLIGKVDLQGREPPPAAKERSRNKNYESEILHGKEPAENCPVSSEEDLRGSKTDINVIFDPKDPSNSVVEGRRSSGQGRKRPLKPEEKMSRIRLNETVNLDLHTGQGQDLVISLTVKPKTDAPVSKLSISDIFSESRTNVPERDRRGFQEAERGPKERGSEEDEEPSKEDVAIPLSRTKICSSLEFDVQVVDSRMKSSGIKHTNPNIVVRLNDMGVNNLLRASRPVKCGRKAILNESLKKCLPYSPSLKSLPLEEYDADIIDQSLDMSIKKSKHSTIYIKDDKLAYTVEVTSRRASNNASVKQVYFVQVLAPNFDTVCGKRTSQVWVDRILGYYINIENDMSFIKTSIIEVRYFEIENVQKIRDNSIPATILRVKLKNNECPKAAMNHRSSTEKVVPELKAKSLAKKASKYPSRIPVYQYRYSGGKRAKAGVTQLRNVSDQTSLTKKQTREAPIKSRKSTVVAAKDQRKIEAVQMTQRRSKSVLTLQTDDTSTNPSRTQVYSTDTAAYFEKFMRYISILNQATSSTKQQRKKIEFFTSRSHSLLLMNSDEEKEHSKKESRSTRKQPGVRNESDAIAKEKCIRLNDVVLSSTRFKRQLDHDKTTSRIVINRLSNFLYENFVRGVSPATRVEVLSKIDHLLDVYSRVATKNGVLRD